MTQPRLLTSPSQLQVVKKLCPRKWWLRYVIGCPEPEQTFQGFGKAVHKVIERYLKADATGRDPSTGKAVELYPNGWEKEFNLTPIESDRIKKQIQLGIESGVIYRPSGDYLVESGYEWDMPRVHAKERGYTDLLEEDAVTDHKTTSAKKWALSESSLKEDWQMRAYAMRLVRFYRSKNLTPPEEIRLRHNVFITKESEQVFYRQVSISVEELDSHEEDVHQIVREMIALTPIQATDWRQVPGPRPGSDACNAYRGCPYRNICAGNEQPSAYKLRMANALKSPAQLAEDHKMARPSILGLIKTPTPAPSAPITAPVDAPKAPQPAVPFTQPAAINQPPVASQEAIVASGIAAIQAKPAPWYNPAGCRACGTSQFPGFDSRLRPCRVCDTKSALDGRRTSISYRFGVKDGMPYWEDPAPEPAQPAQTPVAVEKEQLSDAQYVAMLEAPADEEPISRQEIKAREEELVEYSSPGLEKGEENAQQPAKRRGRPPGSKNKPKDGSEMVVTAQTLGEPQVSHFLKEGESLTDHLSKVAPESLAPKPQAEVRNGFNAAQSETNLSAEFRALHARIDALTAAIIQKNGADSVIPEDGFTLIIGNNRPQTGKVIDFFRWLEPLKEECAKHMNVAYYTLANAFARRDVLAAAVHAAAKDITGAYLVVPRELDPDSLVVVNTLRGLAIQVIE